MLRFDIETNGLLRELTTMHCMCISDGENRQGYRPHECEAGVRRLYDAIMSGEQICGHNIIDFDIPAIKKLYPWFIIPRDRRHLVVDTLVLSRLIYANIKDLDMVRVRRGTLPGKLIGRHSLESWGYRLGVLKGTYGHQENAWDKYTEEMLEYNIQDVVVTDMLVDKLYAHPYPQVSIDLEHQAQWLMSQQTRNGFDFDYDAAVELEVNLRCRQAVLEAELCQIVPRVPDKIFIPKRDNKTRGYKAGVPIQRYKDFNPNSRQQIEWLIRDHYNYSPDEPELYDIPMITDPSTRMETEDTDQSHWRLKINDETFSYLKEDTQASDEVRRISGILEESLMIGKRLGQLIDGKQGWLKAYDKVDGKIHGSVNPNGAVSGRATHSHPNVAQVPAIDKPYGPECRSLFRAPTGWLQVGVDASGLELRCLGHFMFVHDSGSYANEVINGDIHTINQIAAGLPTRQAAKRFIYAYLYGGGDLLIGKLVGGGSKEGARIKREFLEKTPALKLLKEAIVGALVEEMYHGRVKKWKRKYLRGLDGRPLWVRSLHSALNLLLQSAGALICKKWICRWEERLIERGLKHGWDGDFAFMAWVHDEAQVAARTKEIAEIIKDEGQNAMRDTQAFFNFRVQLDTEGKIGPNWAVCH